MSRTLPQLENLIRKISLIVIGLRSNDQIYPIH